MVCATDQSGGVGTVVLSGEVGALVVRALSGFGVGEGGSGPGHRTPVHVALIAGDIKTARRGDGSEFLRNGRGFTALRTGFELGRHRRPGAVLVWMREILRRPRM